MPCSLVWPGPVLPLLVLGVGVGLPVLLSRLRTPLQLVARLSIGALARPVVGAESRALLAGSPATGSIMLLYSAIGLTMGLAVGSANSSVTCEPPWDSYVCGRGASWLGRFGGIECAFWLWCAA